MSARVVCLRLAEAETPPNRAGTESATLGAASAKRLARERAFPQILADRSTS